MQNKLNIAFIGGGNMASALIGGLLQSLTAPGNIHVIDLNQLSLQKLQTEFGVSTALAIDEKLAQMDVIILAVKPQQLHEVVNNLAPQIGNQLLISIAAGIRATDIARWLSGYGKIVRTMPNTPALIGQGMTGLFALSAVTADEKQLAERIMQAVGATTWLEDESLMDAVTAVSGSGPAYVFYFI